MLWYISIEKKSSLREVEELGDRIHKSEDIPASSEIPCMESRFPYLEISIISPFILDHKTQRRLLCTSAKECQ